MKSFVSEQKNSDTGNCFETLYVHYLPLHAHTEL